MNDNTRKKAKVIDLETERKRLREKSAKNPNSKKGNTEKAKVPPKWTVYAQAILLILLIGYFMQQCK